MSDDETPRHFSLELRKLSLREFWRAPGRWSFLVGLLVKAIPSRIPLWRALPLSDSLIELDPAALPPAARRLEPVVATLEQLGFTLAFYYREDVVQTRSEDASVALLAPDGRAYASVYVATFQSGGEILRASFLSRLDRRIVVTSLEAPDMDWPPEFDCEVAPASFADAWARHRERISSDHDAYRGSPAAATLDRDELRRFILAISRRTVEHGVARGIFVPLTAAQVTALRRGETVALAKRPRRGATLAVWLALVVVLVAVLALL